MSDCLRKYYIKRDYMKKKYKRRNKLLIIQKKVIWGETM